MLRNLLLVNVAMAAAWDAHSFTVPVVGHARELSASSIGLVLGSFAVAATVVRVAISTWADHIDERRALLGGHDAGQRRAAGLRLAARRGRA